MGRSVSLRQRRLLALLWAVSACAQTASISAERYMEDVRQLTCREMKGRGTGTPELDRAAEFIAGRFRNIGLDPAGGAGYFQEFPVTAGARLGGGNRLQSDVRGETAALKCPDDFVPFNFSSGGNLEGRLVFAGYGITAPEYGYDDYDGLDVRGRIVVVLRHEPQEYDEKSVFAGRLYTQHAQYAAKAANAHSHGASGMILISDRGNHRSERDELEKFVTSAGPMEAGIPCLQVRVGRAEAWFKAAGRDLEAIQTAIDKDLRPRSFVFPESVQVKGRIEIERTVRAARNVAAYLPGTGDGYIIVGAHYDHLGMGEQYSMSPSEAGTTIHPGADDNASGAAGVIELARRFAGEPRGKRGILFLAFAGEEVGLLGSGHYVRRPLLPLADAAAMLNLDMIGRLRDNRVYIGGATSEGPLRKILDRVTLRHGIQADYSDGSVYGASDHTSFVGSRVPVLFFFTGLHGDYHRPSDTWEKIEREGAARLLRMVADVVDELREPERAPVSRRCGPPGGTAPAREGCRID